MEFFSLFYFHFSLFFDSHLLSLHLSLLPSLFSLSLSGEIIESFGEPRHLSTIPLKNFHLFKIAELVINFCFKKNF